MLGRIAKVLLLLVWLLVASFFYGAAWVRNVDLFPPYPQFLYEPLSYFSYSLLPDGYKKLFIEYMGALFYVSIFTLIAFAGYRVYKYFKKPK